MIIRRAELDDWASLSKLHRELLSSRFSKRLGISYPALQQFFTQNLMDPNTLVVIALDDSQENLLGFGVVYTKLEYTDSTVLKRAFIHGVYVPLSSPRETCGKMLDFGEKWAKSLGCDMILAHARLDKPGENNYKFNAVFTKYGFSPKYTILAKSLEV